MQHRPKIKTLAEQYLHAYFLEFNQEVVKITHFIGLINLIEPQFSIRIATFVLANRKFTRKSTPRKYSAKYKSVVKNA